MKKGQMVEGVVKKVKFPNKGIVDVSGEEKSVIVKNVVAGQKIQASINKVRRGQAEGRLLKVLEKAPWRNRSSLSSFWSLWRAVRIKIFLIPSSFK